MQLASDPRIAACDENPLGVTVSIRDTYADALDTLEDVARAAVGSQ
ncbi:MAG: hypothetical protein JO227_21425 [Acetobacteraceae bacterium]|nr:hypothetical protein [Acetobacteraceae bacterium]